MAIVPSTRSLRIWRVVQAAVWLLGLVIVGLLLAGRPLGVTLLWNVLIPAAPALFVFAPGLWRNICPLASTALLARHSGLSARRIMPHAWRIRLNLAAVVLLLLIVPLRHLLLNTNGVYAGLLLLALAGLSIAMGMKFEWKSGWCSGLCPVHPVEKLYGSKPLVQVGNAHCESCQRCVGPCPDSTDMMHPMIGPPWWSQRIMETLIVGGFPGFIWGWFHVPDDLLRLTPHAMIEAYMLPLVAMIVTAAVFVVIRQMTLKGEHLRLVRCFAAASVGCYYWYRLPSLLGVGLFPGDGVLVDLSGYLGDRAVMLMHAASTSLLVWWLVLHQAPSRHWAHRPAFATAEEKAAVRRQRETPVALRVAVGSGAEIATVCSRMGPDAGPHAG